MAAEDPSARVAAAAALLVGARRSGIRLGSLPAAVAPQSEAEAYAIQRAQFATEQLAIGGWKSTMLDAATGIFAPIASNALLDSPALLTPAVAPSAGSHEFGIEPEIAFRMAHTLTVLPASAAARRGAVIAAIGSAHAAIEIVVSRYVDFNAVSAFERLADNILNEALVLGPPCHDWRALDIADLALTVRVDGLPVYSGRGGHPLADPIAPLVWLAGALIEQGLALEAGQVVTTGSCNGLRMVAANDAATVEFVPLGTASIQF